MNDRFTAHGSEDEEITWYWLCLCFGPEGALERIERWQEGVSVTGFNGNCWL